MPILLSAGRSCVRKGWLGKARWYFALRYILGVVSWNLRLAVANAPLMKDKGYLCFKKTERMCRISSPMKSLEQSLWALRPKPVMIPFFVAGV